MPQAVVSVALMVVSSAVQQTMADGFWKTPGFDPVKKAEEAERRAADPNGFREVPVRQALAPRRYVYGGCRVGGAVFFEDNANPYLYVGAALSDGVIQAMDAVWFGNQNIVLAAESPSGQAEAATGNKWYSKYKVSYRLGTVSQTADAMLTTDDISSTLPSDFWQRGVACAVSRLHWGNSSEQHSALWGTSINPTYDIRGVRVYDPRDGAQDPDDETTWVYSDNPALCVLHALTHAWGIALDIDDIDLPSVENAADVCDATTTYASVSVPYFTLAGVFQSEADMAGQISRMLDSFGGAITFSDGKYKMYADAARSSVWTITDDDILELGEYVHSAEPENVYNVISASYFDAADEGATTVTEVYEDAAAATEGVRETTIRLPFTPAVHSAQILAYRALARMRNGRTLTVTVSDAGLWLEAFDVVVISSTTYPAFDGTWDVVQVDMKDVGVELTLREYVSAAYTNPTTYLV